MKETEIQLVVEKKEVICEMTGETIYVPRLREVEVEVIRPDKEEDKE